MKGLNSDVILKVIIVFVLTRQECHIQISCYLNPRGSPVKVLIHIVYLKFRCSVPGIPSIELVNLVLHWNPVHIQ